MSVKSNETIYPRGNYTEEQPGGGYRFKLPVHIKQYLKDTEENKMTIENQIAIHCDEANEISACELLDILIKGGEILINNESYNLAEITDSICSTMALYAAEESISNNKHAIAELYINQINKMLGE